MRSRFTSPRGGRRGCLCKNGTYSSKCCKGKLHQQGIGATVGQSTSNIVNTGNIPTYISLIADKTSVDEGQSVVFTLTTANVVNGTVVGYTITGVDSNDIGESLTGTLTIQNNNATKTITLVEDLIEEGAETLTLTLNTPDSAGTDTGNLSASVLINDTSVKILDKFPNASAGYALELLRTNYTGALVRVRKDVGGQPERDVLPDSNGEVSLNSPLVGSGQTLGQFVNNADGYMTVKYDQKNTHDGSQTFASNQPKLIENGVLLTKQSKVGLKFLNDYYKLPLSIYNDFDNNNYTFSCLINTNDNTKSQVIASDVGGSGNTNQDFFDRKLFVFINKSNQKVRFAFGDNGSNEFIDSTTTIQNNTWYLVECKYDGDGDVKLLINGVEEASYTFVNPPQTQNEISIGDRKPFNSFPFDGSIKYPLFINGQTTPAEDAELYNYFI